MKRIKYSIFLLVLMVIPINVFAYELTCDKTTVDYDETFFCYLTGETGQSYKELSGNIISTNDIITCNPTSFSNGLSIMESEKKFAYTGEPVDEKLVTFSCKLTKQLSEVEKAQIKVENFKYTVSSNGFSSDNEILSTDFINANVYTDTSEVDDLPRNTSNPDSLLRVLQEDNLNVVFSRFVTIYNQEVLYEVEKLDLNVTANNPSATIRIIGNGIENNTNLNIGKNEINIFVTSPDGSTTTCYSLNVTRLARGESIYYPEKDATLNSLIVPGYAISFDKDTYEYHIHLTSDVSKLTVNAVPTYDEATVDISSTTNLRNNSIIKVTVTSKDKSTTQEYQIKISKDAPKVNYIPYIIMGLVGILFIVMIILFIKTSKTKKSGGPTVIPDVDLNTNKTQNAVPNNQNIANVQTAEINNQVVANAQTTEMNNQVVTNPQPVQVSPSMSQTDNIQMANNQVVPVAPNPNQVNPVQPGTQIYNSNNMINQNATQNNNINQNNISNENNQ